MDQNRSLDDFVKESRRAKRTGRHHPKKVGFHWMKSSRKNTALPPSTTPAKPNNHNVGFTNIDNGLSRPKGGVSKRRSSNKKTFTAPAISSVPFNTTTPRRFNVDTMPGVSAPQELSPGDENRLPPRRSNLSSAHLNCPRRNQPLNPYPASPSPDRNNSRVHRGVFVAVSNLHPGVTQADIIELFETVGPLQHAILLRKHDGSSTGEANVIFENMHDALEAIKRYNRVPLDNQPLEITLIANRTMTMNRSIHSFHPSGDLSNDTCHGDNTRRPLMESDRAHFYDGDSPGKRVAGRFDRGSGREKRPFSCILNGPRQNHGVSPRRERPMYTN